MSLLGVLLLSASVSAVGCDVHFPPGFKFGAATAAYQIEGAWNLDGKGENIWDRITHTREFYFKDNKTGDVACDSYRLWRRDVEIAAELGLDFYRFSISWSRLLPSGFTNVVNEEAKKYYNNLIDGLLDKSIEPVVTLYHWDLPQRLQDLGGWTNPLVADWFTDYARLAYSLFGDRVKTWITINEPIVVCDLAYVTGDIAPGIKDPVGALLCNKNVLIAHAKAWRVYDEEFRAQFKGQVSLSNHLVWIEPASPGQEEIAELVRQDIVGRYSHPVYSKRGGWPPAVEKIIAENSKKEGFSRSKLPVFTEAEIELVKGTYDFYGFNQYTTRLARILRPGEPKQPLPFGGDPEIGAMFSTHPDWEQTTAGWFYECYEYHLYDKNLFKNLSPKTTVSIISNELFLRERFLHKYDIIMDTGHQKWMDFLRNEKKIYERCETQNKFLDLFFTRRAESEYSFYPQLCEHLRYSSTGFRMDIQNLMELEIIVHYNIIAFAKNFQHF